MAVKTAYLTVDDAPSGNMKRKVDYLASRTIPAVWFCLGKNIEERPEHVIHAIRKGFVIGNHSYSHRSFSDMRLEQCFEEIKNTDDIIEGVYEKAGVKRQARFFRFPYGDKGGFTHGDVFKRYNGKGKIRKERIQEFLTNLGYTQPEFKNITYVHYRRAGLLKDVDWYWTYAAEWAAFVKNPLYVDGDGMAFDGTGCGVQGCGGMGDPSSDEIILIHDHELTSFVFSPIVESLLRKGIVFKSPVGKLKNLNTKNKEH